MSILRIYQHLSYQDHFLKKKTNKVILSKNAMSFVVHIRSRVYTRAMCLPCDRRILHFVMTSMIPCFVRWLFLGIGEGALVLMNGVSIGGPRQQTLGMSCFKPRPNVRAQWPDRKSNDSSPLWKGITKRYCHVCDKRGRHNKQWSRHSSHTHTHT